MKKTATIITTTMMTWQEV